MNKLKQTYSDITSTVSGTFESFETVSLIEEYRQYWKPSKVRVVLLAESHVFTEDIERQLSLKEVTNLPNYPSQFARFVYCLAYGENDALTTLPKQRNSGTPQFWKIFHSCANSIQSNECFNPIKSTKTPTNQRLKNKINLLNQLKSDGVWLIDASIVALYNQGNKPNLNIMQSVIQKSWAGYTRDAVINANPEHVIIIGKGVASHIEKDVAKIMGKHYSVIAQPNAHLSASEHLENFQNYYKICRQR